MNVFISPPTAAAPVAWRSFEASSRLGCRSRWNRKGLRPKIRHHHSTGARNREKPSLFRAIEHDPDCRCNTRFHDAKLCLEQVAEPCLLGKDCSLELLIDLLKQFHGQERVDQRICLPRCVKYVIALTSAWRRRGV